jgi:hypothetical protein
MAFGFGICSPMRRRNDKDPISCAIIVFEDPRHAPSDEIVYQILTYLCRSRVKVRQGKSSTWVDAPVDFSDLSSEYIGILYEGLRKARKTLKASSYSEAVTKALQESLANREIQASLKDLIRRGRGRFVDVYD